MRETSMIMELTNELRIPRSNEWLCRGIPFPQGVLTDVDKLRLSAEKGEEVPLAHEVLGRWPDGSAKWVLFQFPVDFEREGKITHTLDWSGKEGVGHITAPGINIVRHPDHWEVDNGCLRFRLPLEGTSFISGLKKYNEPLLTEMRAEISDDAGNVFTSKLNTEEPVIEHHTAKMLVISRKGIHLADNKNKFFSCVFRLTIFADSDELEIEYQFINDEPWRDNAQKHGEVHGLTYGSFPALTPEHPGMRGVKFVRLALSHAVGNPEEYVTCPLSTVGNKGLISHPHPVRVLLVQGIKNGMYDFMGNGEVLSGDTPIGKSHGWIAVGNGTKGLALSVRKFVQQWPKGLAADASGIVIDLWPEAAGGLNLFQGQAKSHQFKLRAFTGTASDTHLPDWHFAFQFPIVLSAPNWFLDSGAIGPVLRYQPRKYPGIEGKFRREFEQFLGYTRLLGMMDYGDCDYESGATWGRGAFMTNLEHDFAQAVWLQFVRTGSYRYIDFVEAGVRHVMDVDIVHFDDTGDDLGGWRMHGPEHVFDCCGMSHVWAESFVSYYQYTGYVPALTAARNIADWIMRRIEKGVGLSGARERGWPLIALCAVYQATGEKKYIKGIKTIISSFEEGNDPLEENGGLSGGHGPIPYQQACMGSVAATGLAYCHRTFGDDQSRRLFLRICDWLCSDAVRTPEGLYMGMPGNNTSMAYTLYTNYRESLGYAWKLTGDIKYIETGMLHLPESMVSMAFANAGNLPPMKTRNGQEVLCASGVRMSTAWRENIRFMHYADNAGLLKDF